METPYGLVPLKGTWARLPHNFTAALCKYPRCTYTIYTVYCDDHYPPLCKLVNPGVCEFESVSGKWMNVATDTITSHERAKAIILVYDFLLLNLRLLRASYLYKPAVAKYVTLKREFGAAFGARYKALVDPEAPIPYVEPLVVN